MFYLSRSRVWAIVQELGGQGEGDITVDAVTERGGFFRQYVQRYLWKLCDADLIYERKYRRNAGPGTGGNPSLVYRLGPKPPGFKIKPFIPLTNEQVVKGWRKRYPDKVRAYKKKIRQETEEERQQRLETRRKYLEEREQRKAARAHDITRKAAKKAVEKVGADPLSAFLYGKKS